MLQRQEIIECYFSESFLLSSQAGLMLSWFTSFYSSSYLWLALFWLLDATPWVIMKNSAACSSMQKGDQKELG